MLVHFTWLPDREAQMLRCLERAEERSAEWEVPLERTRYPAEVRQERKASDAEAVEFRQEVSEYAALVEEWLQDYGGSAGQRVVDGVEWKMQKAVEAEMNGADVAELRNVLEELRRVAKPLEKQAEYDRGVVSEEAQELMKKVSKTIATEPEATNARYERNTVEDQINKLKGTLTSST
ncbi:hypothetical protein LTS18_007664 [Coniosporium uncinatum]|uniref:Uncharacterized protein n=1 Tax=Coniosporium uncinatum TaxID=93489 RepID=A0ACC3DCU7_9PEZI|nr:hypothetical protein LTS18_007664 [Coniosporium uncinatum]